MTEDMNNTDDHLEDDAQQDSGSPDATVARLEKELAKARKQAGGYRVQRNELTSQLDELRLQLEELKPLKSLVETLAPQLDGIKSQLAQESDARKQAELKTVRMEAAAKAGLPIEFADRLQGSTLEEITADAATLASALPIPRQARPGNGSLPTPENAAAEILRRTQRGSGNAAFDINGNQGRGGGVISKK